MLSLSANKGNFGMINSSRMIVDRTVKQKRARLKPCVNPNNIKKGDETFIGYEGRKEDLFDKYLWNHLL
jgi:hypothetical protein